MPRGLDYSAFLQDTDEITISNLDRKDAEDKLRRNQSGGQLSSLGEIF